MSAADMICRSAFGKFINSPVGRLLRVAVGVALIYWGYTNRATTSGMVVMVVGLIPLSAGAFDLCYLCALVGGPLKGSALRQ